MKFPNNRLIHITILAAATILVTYFYPRQEQNMYRYEQGRPWTYAQLVAPFDIPIHPDSSRIRQARDSLNKAFIPIYTRDESILDRINDSLYKKIGAFQANLVMPAVRNMYSRGVIPSSDERDKIPGTSDSLRLRNRNNVLSRKGVNEMTSLEHVQQTVSGIIHDQTLRQAALNIMTPNIVYDREMSQRMYEQELLPYSIDLGVIQQGQTIIDKGAIVSAQDCINLATYERMLSERNSSEIQSQLLLILGEGAFVLLIFVALTIYLASFAKNVYEDKRQFLSVILLITVFFIFAVAMNHFIPNGIYIVPFSIVPILILVFFDARTAIFTHIAEVMLCAAFAPFTLEFIFMQLAGGCAAVFTLEQLSKRSELLRTAIFVAVTYWISYLAIELMLNGSMEGISWRIAAYITISAVLTSFAYILMFVYEKAFGLISVVTLVELADINHPLLRELSDNCPGTFQHSMAVSNLASDAALKIGANVQLVRAGALYHDIGKLSNPAFFTENQSGVNPHEALSPVKSAEIVINHVTDGLRRADKANLPSVIRNFISEHHGAGKAKYFYYTYCNQHPDENVDPAPFTYPGPNPRSRETSILMMADAVEAASRSLKEHTPDAISNLVNKIIDGQIADGLHNDSPLSFRDINMIKETFIRRLKTIYHSRISYPDAPSKKETTADSGNNTE